MKLWRAKSFDHRLADPSDETSACELFASSRGAALKWIREQVREALQADAEREPDLYDPSSPSAMPYAEVYIEQVELVDVEPKALVLRCLNGGWLRCVLSTETFFLNKNGRETKSPNGSTTTRKAS